MNSALVSLESSVAEIVAFYAGHEGIVFSEMLIIMPLLLLIQSVYL